jgi:hypothetical protein
MKFIVTIDTEEDDWAQYARTGSSVTNTGRIAALQVIFDRFGVRPTYLVTYPVATDSQSVMILRRILDAGRCEIGMHCHPWNTPPLSPPSERTDGRMSMLCNLPEDVQRAKLSCLAETIAKNFGVGPVSFRAGRWGFDASTARCLPAVGVSVDSSITPYTDWGAYGGPDHSDYTPRPFRYWPIAPPSPLGESAISSIPASIGYLQANFAARYRLDRRLSGPLSRRLRIKGVLDRAGILSKVWLSPEFSSVRQMVGLIDRMERERFPCVNMTFHSPTLIGGLTPLLKHGQEDAFLERITSTLAYARERGCNFLTLAECAQEAFLGVPDETSPVR